MRKLLITIDDIEFTVEASETPGPDGFVSVTVNGQPTRVALADLTSPEGIQWAVADTRPYELQIDPELRWIQSWRGRHTLQVRDLESRITRPVSGDGRIKAPIPGVVVRILVDADQPVDAGQPLMVLEAMKMENEIRASRAGRVASINVRPGQAVRLHDQLAEIA